VQILIQDKSRELSDEIFQDLKRHLTKIQRQIPNLERAKLNVKKDPKGAVKGHCRVILEGPGIQLSSSGEANEIRPALIKALKSLESAVARVPRIKLLRKFNRYKGA
jgi:ribosome-associated translation inhibitor RaiA